MENMENNPKNWFVRILIILFCLGIASMIFFNFFCVEPTVVFTTDYYSIFYR